MSEFCGKCGAKLDKKSGKCPYCDGVKNNKEFNNKKKLDPDVKAKTKRKNKGLIVFAAIFIIVLIIAVILVLNIKSIMPKFNELFVSMGQIEETTTIPDVTNTITDNTANTADVDLGENYTVPAFDAEKYFDEYTQLVSKLDVPSSQTVFTANEAYKAFEERGFSNVTLMYEYDMSGEYLGEQEASYYSDDKAPIYQAYYSTSDGNLWIIMEVNGEFFATPVFYNLDENSAKYVIISEKETITSYDSTTNKFYVNVPDQSNVRVKVVGRIDAETIETLTKEEIEK